MARFLVAALAALLVMALGVAPSSAQKADITNLNGTISLINTVTGAVIGSPSDINCGNACSASLPLGTPVTRAAVANSGSTFGGCSGIGNCGPFTLTGNEAVTATFVQNTTDANVVLAAAVLPLSRSVTVGAPATAFATIINGGADDASTCSIAPATSIPADFFFQTTDPTTNNETGTPNTPVDIPAGKLQTFVIALTPTVAFTPTLVAFTFTCANALGPASLFPGINALLLSASTTPVPDIVALGASADPGYADLNKIGVGDFAVATINLGSADNITVMAIPSLTNLPVTLLVCQTDPASGVCTSNNGAAAPSVTTQIGVLGTPTFGIFINSAGHTIADLPGANRAFVTFTDSNGVLRGETSVAIRTH
jgi:hypothetical protein